MKLMWFHLMPYTELPDDFRDHHPSVWVDIHSSLFDPLRAHHMYNEFMDELEFAAECGFDAICVNEHHSNGYGLMPSPNLVASALARRTFDAALCVLGNSLALYNPPTRVAEEFAMIDCISGGNDDARERKRRPQNGAGIAVTLGARKSHAPAPREAVELFGAEGPRSAACSSFLRSRWNARLRLRNSQARSEASSVRKYS
jgi:hypothetical protein